jgi:hypothetical protein
LVQDIVSTVISLAIEMIGIVVEMKVDGDVSRGSGQDDIRTARTANGGHHWGQAKLSYSEPAFAVLRSSPSQSISWVRNTNKSYGAA